MLSSLKRLFKTRTTDQDRGAPDRTDEPHDTLPVVGRFAPGDDVPDWLVDVMPLSPRARRPEITFVQPVVIVRQENVFRVLPTVPGVVISIDQGRDGRVYAASGRVELMSIGARIDPEIDERALEINDAVQGLFATKPQKGD